MNRKQSKKLMKLAKAISIRNPAETEKVYKRLKEIHKSNKSNPNESK